MLIKRDDIVEIISGEDRGKQGKVTRILIEAAKVVIEGANMTWKHVKKSEKHPKGGRIKIESPIHVSNVMLICQSCGKPTRPKLKIVDNPDIQKKSRLKIRVCKKCAGPIRPEQ